LRGILPLLRWVLPCSTLGSSEEMSLAAVRVSTSAIACFDSVIQISRSVKLSFKFSLKLTLDLLELALDLSLEVL